MRALLDTQAFLWGVAGDPRMSQTAREVFVGPSTLSISIASIWEMLIKVQIGKLKLPRPAGSYIITKLADNKVEILSIELDHLIAFENLALHHRDPFDRILIAQSIAEGWPIITADRDFQKYPVRVIW
jgi:PIN domain nuclease of toxin-antitoxin system